MRPDLVGSSCPHKCKYICTRAFFAYNATMKNRAILGLACALWVLPGLTQQAAPELPKLDAALAIDVRIKSVEWHPHAKALFYTRDEDTGTGLGFYVPGDKEGKVLIHLPKDDTYQMAWFPGRTAALIWTTHPVSKESNLFRFYVVDPETKQTLSVYEEEGTVKSKLNFDVDISPLLRHAIVTRSDVSGQKHLVLPDGSNKLVSALDLDNAAKGGYSGPTWSVDGTAIYGNGGGGNPLQGLLNGGEIKLSTNGGQEGTALQGFSLVLSGESLNSSNGASFVIRFSPPVPAVGATVMELMPTNAFLRSVKFKGPWAEKEEVATMVAPENRLSRLDFGVSRGYASSWWLKLPDMKAEQGVLVAADAAEAYLSPENRAVAYVTNGALFVRTFTKKK